LLRLLLLLCCHSVQSFTEPHYLAQTIHSTIFHQPLHHKLGPARLCLSPRCLSMMESHPHSEPSAKVAIPHLQRPGAYQQAALKYQHEVPSLRSNNCRAHVERDSSRSNTDPFHLCMCLQRWRSSSNTHSLAKAYKWILVFCMMRIRISCDMLETYEDVRSEEGSTAVLQSWRAARRCISIACELSR
jgi:hypothetical protein